MSKTLSSINKRWLWFSWSLTLANCSIQPRQLRNLQREDHQRWRRAQRDLQRELAHPERAHRMPFQLLAMSKVTNNWLWMLINLVKLLRRKVSKGIQNRNKVKSLKCKLKMSIWRLNLKRKSRSEMLQRQSKLSSNPKQPKKLKSHLKLIQIEEGAWTNADDHPDLALLSSSKS